MTWAKLDDQLHGHPKMGQAGLEAIGLWTLALSWSSCYLTDGFIPEVQITKLGGNSELVERLLITGLWERRDGGYQIHDYLRYNPSRAKVKTMRQARAEAGREGGLRSGEARRKQAKEEAEANGKQMPSKKEAKTNPVPVPVPESPSPAPKDSPSAGADAPSPPPPTKASQPKPKKPDPLTAGQRGFLDLFGAKRFKTVAQRDAVLVMEHEHSTEKLLEVARWAAEKGMTVGKAVGSVRSALPNWGKPKRPKASAGKHSGPDEWLARRQEAGIGGPS